MSLIPNTQSYMDLKCLTTPSGPLHTTLQSLYIQLPMSRTPPRLTLRSSDLRMLRLAAQLSPR